MARKYKSLTRGRLFFAFSLLFLIILLVSTEVLLRGSGYGQFGVERSIKLREWNPGYHGREFVKAVKLEESEGLEAISYEVRVDDRGFLRDAGPIATDQPTYFLLGGSQIEGLYLPTGGRIDVLVEERLKRSGHAANVVNAGKSGNHTLDSTLIFLTKVIPMQPRRVYLLHNTNDQFHLLRSGSYWPENHERQLVTKTDALPWYKRVGRRVLPGLYQYASEALWKFRASKVARQNLDPFWVPSDDIVRKHTNEFRSALRAFVALGKEWDIEVTLVTQFTNYGFVSERQLVDTYFKSDTDFDRFRESVSRWNSVVRTVARETNVDLLDADRELSNRPELYYDALHLNEKGMVAFADLISIDVIRSEDK
jgi:lysophospholipase L1-like esterase